MALGGCEPILPDPYPVIWEGRYVEVAAALDLPICGGTLGAMDQMVSALRRDMGYSELPEKIRYYYVRSGEIGELELCSGLPAGACAPGLTIFSPAIPHIHELAHAVRGSERERLATSWLFEEGLAESYAIGVRTKWARQPQLGIGDYLRSVDSLPYDSSLYEPASHLVSYLEEQYGKPTVVEFIDDLSARTDWAKLQRSFEWHTGESLVSALEGYADYPRCSKFSQSSHPFECSQPAVEPDPDGIVQVTGTVDCGDVETIGPAHKMMWRTYKITIRDPGPYALEISNGVVPDGSTRLDVTSCDDRCSTPVDFVTSLSENFVRLEFVPGDYLIRVARESNHPGAFEMRVLPPARVGHRWCVRATNAAYMDARGTSKIVVERPGFSRPSACGCASDAINLGLVEQSDPEDYVVVRDEDHPALVRFRDRIYEKARQACTALVPEDAVSHNCDDPELFYSGGRPTFLRHPRLGGCDLVAARLPASASGD
jgi:hypothetical protein